MLIEELLKMDDGVQLTIVMHPKVIEPKAVLCLVHGIGEHARRYEEVMDYMAGEGIQMIGLDLRGHGKSPGKRGVTSPRGLILADIDNLVLFARRTWPGLPVYIYGHSMGGNFGLSHRLYGAEKATGYVITSPWLILHKKIPAVQVFMMRILTVLMPNMTIDNGLDSSQISTIQDEAVTYDKDQMNHPRIGVKAALECLDYSIDVIKHAPEAGMPVLLMHGSEDTICSPTGSRTFKAAAGDSCTYIEYKGMRHELHRDIVRTEARKAIRDWVLKD